MQGVAILRAGSEHLINLRLLRERSLKVRTGVTCIPDLILTIGGCTGAFMLLPDKSVPQLNRQVV